MGFGRLKSIVCIERRLFNETTSYLLCTVPDNLRLGGVGLCPRRADRYHSRRRPRCAGSRSARRHRDGNLARVARPPSGGDRHDWELHLSESSAWHLHRQVRAQRLRDGRTAVDGRARPHRGAERDMRPAGVTESVNVVAETPAPIATPIVGANFKHEEIESLPAARTLAGIAELSPGLTNVTPNGGQVSINGAFAFDNVFMLNGVDINDNLFGSPQNLFIEDAIQETQTLTSGIGAEYGRFSGGVVNAITKSGGNIFSGSGRLNLTNPHWSTQTPFEVQNNTTHKDILNKNYEGTFGGPIMRDRLWFFAAGRWATTSTAQTFPETGLANTQTDENKRGEGKLTGTVAPNHTIQGGYLNNNTVNQSRPTFGFSIDPFTVGNRTLPNWFYFTNYRGVLSSNLMLEAQYSQRDFGFRDAGGSSTNIVDSTILTLSTSRHYN